MSVVAVVAGLILVLSVLADMVNTLVATSTSTARWWLTARLYQWAWGFTRRVAGAVRSDAVRERLLATFAPVSVLALLGVWVVQQVLGFGLIWWGMGGISGAESLADSIYYSGVVYFTLGFGELVPTEIVPRIGALVEALSGVLTTALVIGYLPALYSAYSERERQLLMLDDATEGRMTPANLLKSRAPNGDIESMYPFFESWEAWVASVIETHSTFPMLVLFRSKDPGQHWITALGVVTDAALQSLLVKDTEGSPPYWFLRRAIRLFDQLTAGVDLTGHRMGSPDFETFSDDDRERFLRSLYDDLADHGFDLVPYEEGLAALRNMRERYAAALEYLIDSLLAPRGFWGHAVGHRAGWYQSSLPE
jgi:hypothetical protein